MVFRDGSSLFVRGEEVADERDGGVGGVLVLGGFHHEHVDGVRRCGGGGGRRRLRGGVAEVHEVETRGRIIGELEKLDVMGGPRDVRDSIRHLRRGRRVPSAHAMRSAPWWIFGDAGSGVGGKRGRRTSRAIGPPCRTRIFLFSDMTPPERSAVCTGRRGAAATDQQSRGADTRGRRENFVLDVARQKLFVVRGPARLPSRPWVGDRDARAQHRAVRHASLVAFQDVGGAHAEPRGSGSVAHHVHVRARAPRAFVPRPPVVVVSPLLLTRPFPSARPSRTASTGARWTSTR